MKIPALLKTGLVIAGVAFIWQLGRQAGPRPAALNPASDHDLRLTLPPPPLFEESDLGSSDRGAPASVATIPSRATDPSTSVRHENPATPSVAATGQPDESSRMLAHSNLSHHTQPAETAGPAMSSDDSTARHATAFNEIPPAEPVVKPESIPQVEPMPVAFQVDQVPAKEFSAEQDTIIHDVQQGFVDEVTSTPASDPTTQQYLEDWKKARWNADNRLRLELGGVGFNQFNSLAAQEAEAQRNREDP